MRTAYFCSLEVTNRKLLCMRRSIVSLPAEFMNSRADTTGAYRYSPSSWARKNMEQTVCTSTATVATATPLSALARAANRPFSPCPTVL